MFFNYIFNYKKVKIIQYLPTPAKINPKTESKIFESAA